MEDLEELILILKPENFFLSPKEKTYLNLLIDMGVKKEAILGALRDEYLRVPIRKRSKIPIYFFHKKILELNESILKSEELSWYENYLYKIKALENYIKLNPFLKEINIPKEAPSTEKEAILTIKALREKLAAILINKLPKEEKESIFKKYNSFRREREIYEEFISREVLSKFSIDWL